MPLQTTDESVAQSRKASANVEPNRWSQAVACTVASLFLLGFFVPLLGAWTGAILGVWFVGTQKPRRGFLWLIAITFFLSLASNWRRFPLRGPQRALEYVAWVLLVAVLGVLPFLFHRLTSPRLPGFASTLPLPLAGAPLATLAAAWLPPNIYSFCCLAETQRANTPLLHIAAVLGIGAIAFFVYWFAAALLWMWNGEFRGPGFALGASVLGVVYTLAAGYGLVLHWSGAVPPATPPIGAAFPWACCGGAIALSVWALLRPRELRAPWANRPEIALLQSPSTRAALQLVGEDSRETLVSPSGERFAIRDGIPIFLKPEELTGSNRKYNHLYETIGGFYDDTQRVACALHGVDRDVYFLSYLSLLEIRPGDSVLETSVGTGLNLKYLPRGLKLFGLDLSPEMLANCETNLRRWRLDADLFVGNAESLPFADGSFDVVFHVGGINFFSDRAKAIHEMIRVAKPGSRILIADETETHVKDTYERMPIARGYFKGRKEAVAAPMDLLPPAMREVHLELLMGGRFYALTFRKPAAAD